VIAASCDSKYTHLAWVNTPRSEGGLGDMQIPIIADFDKAVGTKYGCLLPNGEPLRALYLIDPAGVLRQMTINDHPVGRSVDETIRLVKAFQFNAKYGEVCPANWQPGDMTMDADPVKSKSYFHAVNPSAAATTSQSSKVAVITSVDDMNAAKKASGLVVVDFWAPWCKNCKKITPALEKYAGEMAAVSFYKCNTVDAEDVASEYHVDVLPTIQFFKNGKLVGDFKGSDLNALDAAIKAHAA
jgi:thioredoxin